MAVGIDSANKRLNADTFYLEYVNTSGASSGIASALVWNATTQDWIPSGQEYHPVMVSRSNGSTISTKSTFSFTDNGNGTATLRWTHSDAADITLLATPHSGWIEFQITALTLTAVDDNVLFRVNAVGASGQALVNPTMYYSTYDGSHNPTYDQTTPLPWNSNFVWTHDATLAFGLVGDDAHPGYFHHQSGGRLITLVGKVHNGANAAATAAAMVGRKFGLYLCTKAPATVSAMLSGIATGLGNSMTSRQYVNPFERTIFITDNPSGQGSAILQIMRDLDADLVFFLHESYLQDGTKWTLNAGVTTAISAIKAGGKKVGMHLYPYSQKRSGAGGWEDAAYAGQFKTVFTSYISVKHWGDAYASPTVIEGEMDARLLALYSDAGFNGPAYLDGCSNMDDSGLGTVYAMAIQTAEWVFAQRAIRNCVQGGIPVLGASSAIGHMLLNRFRHNSDDIGQLTDPNEPVDDQISNYDNWAKYFGFPVDMGWYALKNWDGTYRTDAQFAYLRARAAGLPIQLQGSVSEFQTAIAAGLASKIRPVRPAIRRPGRPARR